MVVPPLRARHSWRPALALMLLALLLCPAPPAQADRFAVVTRTTEDGLGQSQVRAILQDHQGFLWLGTHVGGVDRFDGLEFAHHTVRHGLPSNLVIDLAEEGGALLAGTRLGLARLGADGRFTPIPLPEGFEDPQVNDLEPARGGGLWVATYSGLFKLSAGVLTPVPGIPPQVVRAVAQEPGGALWVATDEGLWMRPPGDAFRPHPAAPPEARFRKIEADPRGGVWLATRHGLFRGEGGALTLIPLKTLGTATPITALYVDPAEDQVWIGSPLGATAADTQGEKVHLGPAEGLPDAMVIAIARDREGTLHLGTNGAGLVSLPPTLFYTWSRPPLVDYAPTKPLWEPRAKGGHTLWIPTLDQGLWRVVDGVPEAFSVDRGLTESAIIFVHPALEGGLWVGHYSGLARIKGETLTPVAGIPPDQASASFLGAVTVPDLGVVFATSQGLLLYKGGAFEALIPKIDEPPGEPLSILGARDGTLWVGTQDGGALQIDPRTREVLTHLKAGAGLPSSSVTAIGEDDWGMLFFGTDMGVGVYAQGKSQASITGDQGLPEGYIGFIAAAPRGAGEDAGGDKAHAPTVWFGTMGGLARFDGEKIDVFGRGQGLPSGEANTSAVAVDPEGRMWFGMEGGYGVYDPESAVQMPVPDTLITSTRVGQEVIQAAGMLELPHDRNDLRWDFVAPTFVDPRRVTYRARLLGARPKWEELRTRQASYPTLEPGSYTFEVMACVSGRCDPTPARSRVVVIRPPWYETPAAIFTFVLGIFMAGLSVTYGRYARQRQRALLLEAQVQERTAELVAEQERNETLLLNILPGPILAELKAEDRVAPRRFGDVTILFTDLQGFTQAASQVGPERLVEELNEIFATFDEITQRHGLEKLKTIGDAYMAVGGLPLPNTTHPEDAVRVGLEMQAFMVSRLSRPGAMPFRLRVGVHTGPVVAAVIGTWKYAYDIWGDAVNVASRMESGGSPGEVNVSKATYERIRGSFTCVPRGALEVKGKGALEMFFVREGSPNGGASPV